MMVLKHLSKELLAHCSESMLSCPNTLKIRVRSSTNVQDLIPILNHIPLEQIQQFLIQHIDTLNTNSLRRLNCDEASVNDIFSSDIMQYILSFCNDPDLSVVSKKWNILLDKNEVQSIKDIYSSIRVNEQKRNKLVPYNDTINTTFIIDQSRNKLCSIEKEKGYKRTQFTYWNIWSECQHGDRVFILDKGSLLIDGEINTDIQIIGAGNHIKMLEIKIKAIDEIPLEVYLEGIEVNTIYLHPRCSLWMENCSIRNIYVREKANLNLDNCELTDELVINSFANNVNITNSKLGSVDIGSQVGTWYFSSVLEREWSQDELVNFTCVGNVFTSTDEAITEFHGHAFHRFHPLAYKIINNKMLDEIIQFVISKSNSLLANRIVFKT
eukprot:508537_1